MTTENDINRVRAESKPKKSQAERFHALFAGLDRAYGQTKVKVNAKANPDTGKVEAECLTVHRQPTTKQWKQHLDGLIGFGAFALTDANTCRWGAIDIDVYRGFDPCRCWTSSRRSACR
jgi:hypothetical protein